MAPTLTQAAAMWPTATAHDGRRPGSEEGSTQGANLKREAEQWQTPAAENFRSRGGEHVDEPGLDRQARMWQTPSATGGGTRRQVGSEEYEPLLAKQAEVWATPQAFDSVNFVRPKEKRQDGRGGYMNLREQVHDVSLQPPTTPKDGQPSSESAPASRRRLNILFVEWLMNFPEGWTSLAPLGSGSLVTASSRSRLAGPGAS